MNEQHLEGYLHLVQALLSCPSGEEAAILNANSELLDARLVQVMTEVAENLAENGDKNAANFLQSVAIQIIELVENPSIAESQEYLTFLLQVLQIVSDTGADPRVFYPFLQSNLDKLDVKLSAALLEWATTFLSESTADEAESVVSIICNFGSLIQQFPLGSRNVNIELAIVAYQIGLSFFTRELYPENWALCETNLGRAYSHRIIGQRSENLEIAIQCYSAALEVYTPDTFPQEWASLQNSLANAYSDRILGMRSDNLEKAIMLYTSALQVYSCDDFPEQWATTQNNLGTAYKSRILGEQPENLEMAICFYQAALKVHTPEAFPEQWAATQNNLATVYRDRILGDRANNLETAISFYEMALQVYTRENFPSDWAMIINNLGIVYQDRIFGDQAENLENAIYYYQAALEVRTRENFPEQWAATQNNLATFYSDRIKGNRAENIEKSISCYHDVLTVYTRETFPYQWAMTQNNLGKAYSDRIRGFKSQNVAEAIEAYRRALEIFTPQTFPLDCLKTGKNMGNTAFDAELWDIAIEGFAVAIEAVEQSRSWAASESRKQEILEEAIDIYEKIVQSYVNIDRHDRAIEYVELSKTRNLVDILSSRGLYPTKKIPTDNDLRFSYHVKLISFARIQALLKFEFDENTAIIEWYIVSNKIFTFIITSQCKSPIVWQSSHEDIENLLTWFGEYLEDYGQNTRQWQEQLSARLQHLAQILNIDRVINYLPADCDRIIFVPHRFLHLLPLHALPLNEGQNHNILDHFLRGVSYAPSCQLLQLSQKRKRSDLIHLFAIQNPTQDLSFTDIEVETIRRYFAPNDYVLVKKIASKKEILDNKNFLDANCVHFSCHGYFNFESPLESALILAEAEGSNGQLQGTASENNRSLDSTKINLDKCLTLEEILNLDLSQCCLVTLSACETGLIDFTSKSDEYMGFPSGFLLAGSSSVVSSLWAVNDFSTSFLMIRFYENLQSQTSVATALCQAQLWLRDITMAELKLWIDRKQLPLNPTHKMALHRMFQTMQDNSKPFQDPFYWAAFSAVGEFKLH
ncbi:MAG: CHAT domain-containing protein [Microcoleus sp. PH2017_22_RUC_O_B]|uniref:CHAT domain-containing protein n=1 Tax=unclassified Microcoleus TaxID=2642155 RepID=UPI001E0AC3EB|nr:MULTISPECIES: CHAT domain-containing protein [unclassified Microcoleus]MCC3527847.1 CHAT domain-containing protein [Microcoleus sp. PH2017_21_RUC_O_A]MCC3539919.1 CHAT domain-containing protein [Microcoleus sp. PH2017_22_RUC_O_B]